MTDLFAFDDPFYPVPSSAVEADPSAAIRGLLYRVANLERSLEEERTQAIIDLGEVLLQVASLSDDITHIIERWGVATSPQEASLVRSVVAMGKKLVAILDHHQVRPIETIGKPVDAETSDMAGSEPSATVAENIALREEQIGYTWKYGLLRRARLVVSSGPDGSEKGELTESSFEPDDPPTDEDAPNEPDAPHSTAEGAI
ncbi:MAG: nucleotide exchange factor GrpE [Chloroflexi bacterium RBG_13_56_8]|nr:MAG: nucleotide exchange factor GrpE [Chloroflexi bacterium RBG_13_56_8]